MRKPEKKRDRRKKTRFIPPGHTFAALGEKFSRVGKIRNISLDGLVFEYVIEMEFLDIPQRVDIFLAGNRFHMSRIPCRKIYDRPVHLTESSGPHARPLIAKRCGLQFGKLSDTQERELASFIRTHAVGIA